MSNTNPADAPIPTEVVITPVMELDAIVHQMALEAQRTNTAPVIEAEVEVVVPAEIPTAGPFTVMEPDGMGGFRGHTYDTDSLRYHEPHVEVRSDPLDVGDEFLYRGEVDSHAEFIYNADADAPTRPF
ncbi:MAG: hypothetical protein IBJ03_18410 [Gemmatimonadaceae bacterium]|nr:hypothetical protein [Gemmatimonadaceae bacterium]